MYKAFPKEPLVKTWSKSLSIILDNFKESSNFVLGLKLSTKEKESISIGMN